MIAHGPTGRTVLRTCLLTAGLAAPLAAQPPMFQLLDWPVQGAIPIPAHSHFGDRVAWQRGGDVMLVAAPDGGARTGYAFDDVGGWAWSYAALLEEGPQFIELAPDLPGIAFTELRDDDLTDIRLFVGPAVPESVLEGVSGFITALAKHGETLVIGQAAFASGAGRVRIYQFQPVFGFVLQATYLGESGAALGRSLAIDGHLVVAGAPEEGSCGAVHAYALAKRASAPPEGSFWTEVQVLDCPSATQVDAEFGAALALSDGVLAVGAPRLDRLNPGGGPDFGGIYVYRAGEALFELETFLRPTEAEAGDEFGTSVAMFAPADTPNLVLVAGAPYTDGIAADAGAAYLYFDWGDGWRKQQRFTRLTEGDVRAGASVALGAGGILVGAPRYNGNSILDQGAVFAWNRVVPLFYDGFDRGDLDAWEFPD